MKLNSAGPILLLVCHTLADAFAQGTSFTYQGRLNDNGAPATGTYDLQFAVYDSAGGATLIAGPLTGPPVQVINGMFTVALDFGTNVFTGPARWLGIGVRTNGSSGAFVTLNPRQQVTSTPYALTASEVTGANIARLSPPNTAVQATGTPVITSGFITSANVVNGGSGYVTPPLVTVNDTTGSGAVLGAIVSGGSVIGFTVQNPGSGYSAGTTLTVAPPPSNASQTFAGVNYFAGANSITNSGNILAGNGSGLNNLNASSVSSGTVADARLSANVALLNRTQTFSGTNAFTNVANSFTGDGAGLTSLNASSLTSGTVSDSRLSANVARLNGVNQIFTGPVSFTHISNVFSGTFAGNASGVSNVPLAGIDSETSISPKSLVSTSTLAVGASPFWVLAADLNADGHRDLVSADSGANTLTVLTNNGNGGFVLASMPAVGSPAPASVAAADMNGDGRIDLISADYTAGQAVSISVLTNNGSSGFLLWATTFGGPQPLSAFPLDVNGDGKFDLIAVNAENDTITISTNWFGNNFQFHRTYTVGDGPRFIIPADVNGDGKMDLVTANAFASSLSVLTNNAGVFTLASTPTVGFGPVGIAAADFNGDGRVDLVSVNTVADTLSVLFNNGGGTFTLSSSPAVGLSPYSVATTDFNGDGRPDLVSANAEDSTISILVNDGTGNFTPARTVAVGLDPTSVIAADLNGDGFSDLVTANSDTNTLSMVFNQPARFIGNFVGFGGGLTGISRLDAPDGSPAPALSVDNNGRIGIGTTTPGFQLQLSLDSAAKPNGGSWANSSDARIKKNIQPLTGALDKLTQLRGVSYEWIHPADHANQAGPQGGFIAQEVEKVFPNWVQQVPGARHDAALTPDGKVKSLSLPFEFDALMVEALRELRAENADLKKSVGELKELIRKFTEQQSGGSR